MAWRDIVPAHTPGKSDLPSHSMGVTRGEAWVRKGKREPGRNDDRSARTARDATGINANDRGPIDPRMPHLPPA